ncbi:MAG: hypothetical protein JNJ61_02760 [Anaerolineae bacterium]|nr:hypothetical protein [Anaerolineae bacterium]
MLDDLRRSTQEDDDGFEFDFEEDDAASGDAAEEKVQRLFLGMTAVERMFISIFLFMNVTILGIAFLLATGRLRF